ncbi:MAG TPA: hypothetical protein VIK78_17425 [Ruminiclostridium sp.]
MTPYNNKNKVNDIERPISSNILGRDIFGINANVPSMSKTSIDIQDEEQSIEFISKMK